MARVFNFSAGPSMLPESVLSRAAAEIMDYHGSGQSVMEMSHRSKVFEEIMDEAQNLSDRYFQCPIITIYCSSREELRPSLPRFRSTF